MYSHIIKIILDNDIGASGAISLSKALLHNSSLQQFILSGILIIIKIVLGNDIGDEGITSLSEALLQNSSLQQLNLECISHY